MRKFNFPGRVVLTAAMALGLSTAAQANSVNIDATSGTGTTLMLDAGTYSVSYAGLLTGGAYDAFSYWPTTTGCDNDGANCNRGWVNHFAIDFGQGSGNFDRTDGMGYGLAATTGFRPVWETAERSLAEYSSRTLQSQTLATINGDASYFLNGNGTYNDVTGLLTFTLNTAQDVNFFVIDTPTSDNRGGVSLNVTAVPEPATWAMLIFGFGLIGGAMRRKAKVQLSYA